MRKGLRAVSAGLAAAMLMTIFPLPQMTAAAQGQEIIAVNSDGRRGNGNENGDGLFRDVNALTVETVTDAADGNAYLRVSSAASAGYRRLCQRMNKSAANSLAGREEPFHLVIKSRLRAEKNNAEWVDIGFAPTIPTAANVLWLASISNASTTPGAQLIKVMSDYAQAAVVRGEGNPVTGGGFVPVMILIDVPSGGGDPELSFYADGVKYDSNDAGERFTMPRSDLDTILGGATPRLTYHSGDTSNAAVWSIDDAGIYAVMGTPEQFAAEVTELAVEQGTADITIPFSNEIYTEGFRADIKDSLVTIRSEGEAYAVPMSDISADALQKSLTLRNIQFKEGGRYEISFDGAEDIFGQEYSGAQVTVTCRKAFKIDAVSPADVAKDGVLTVSFSDDIDLGQFYGRVSISKPAGQSTFIPDSALSLGAQNELNIDLTALDLAEAIVYCVSFADGIANVSGEILTGVKSFPFHIKNQGKRFDGYEDYSGYPVGSVINSGGLANMTYDSSAPAVIGKEGIGHYMPLRLGEGQTNKQLRLNFGDAVENILPAIRMETKIKFLAASDTYNARLRFQTLESNDPSINVLHFVNGKISALQAPTAAGAVQVGDIVNDVWYYIRVDVNYNSDKPVMAVTVKAEDGSVDFYDVFDASLSNMLTVNNPSSWGKVGRCGLILASGAGLSILQSYINVTEPETVKILSVYPDSDYDADDLIPRIAVTADGPVLTGGKMSFTNRTGNKIPAKMEYTGFGTGNITPAYPLRHDSVYTVSTAECTDIAGRAVSGGGSLKVSTPQAEPLSITLEGYTPEKMAAGDITANIIINNSGAQKSAAIAIMHCTGAFDAPVVQKYEKTECSIPAGAQALPVTIKAEDGSGFIKVIAYDENNDILLEDAQTLGVSQDTAGVLTEIEGKLDTPCVPVLLNIADGAFVYQSQTDENGRYQFRFSTEKLLPSGVYNYTVTAAAASEQGTVGISNPYEKQEFADALNGATADNIAEIFEAGKHNVNLDEGLRLKLTDEQFYSAVLAAVKKEKLSADGLDNQLNQIMLTECFNLGFYKSIDDEFLALAEPGERYIGYYGDITAAGKSRLAERLNKNKYTLFSELLAQLREQIVIGYICDNKGVGAAFVNRTLNDCAEELRLNLAAYKNLGADKQKSANEKMVKSAGDTDLQAIIDKAVSEASAERPVSGGGGQSSGGGGTAVVKPSDSQNMMTPQEVEEYKNSTGINLVFHDLKGHAWAQEAIGELYQNGIISGRGDGVFDPDSAVTRAEYTQMLMSALSLLQGDLRGGGFSDVSSGDWYYQAVESAATLNIVSGISEDYFGAGECITRQDAAVIAFRAAKYTALTLDGSIENISFEDQTDIDAYAMTATKVLKKMQIINGFDDGCYRPHNTATRAEAAVIIYRIYHLLKGGA